MFLQPVLDPISRVLWFWNDTYCKIPSEPDLVKGLQKLICCKFLGRERMKLIIDQINPCDVVLKKTLQNVSRSLGSNLIILRKFKHTVVCWPAGFICFLNNLLKVAECAGITWMIWIYILMVLVLCRSVTTFCRVPKRVTIKVWHSHKSHPFPSPDGYIMYYNNL